jgi:hypothetical protein
MVTINGSLKRLRWWLTSQWKGYPNTWLKVYYDVSLKRLRWWVTGHWKGYGDEWPQKAMVTYDKSLKRLHRYVTKKATWHISEKATVKSDRSLYDSRMSPDLPRGTDKSIGGDLDIDDEGSEQHRLERVQSLHHGSVGHQPMCTWIGLTKKTMSLQTNWEHKQEQEKNNLKLQMND